MKKINLYEALKGHIVDTTAILNVVNPAYSALETMVIGMSNEVSINAKILGSTFAFFGLGSLVAKGRDKSKELFKIDDKTSKKKQQLHDALYNGAFNLTIAPFFYLASGAKTFKEIALGTVLSGTIGALLGGPVGYSIDAFRDLAGTSESKRLPQSVKAQKPGIKKSIAVLITALSIGSMVAIYSLRPNKIEYKPKAEQHETLNKYNKVGEQIWV